MPSIGRPCSSTSVGTIVWYGRLAGATPLGWRRSVENPRPRLCSTNPPSGTVTPEPNRSHTLEVSTTACSAVNTTVNTVPGPSGIGPCRGAPAIRARISS